MPRYVIFPNVALRLAEEGARPATGVLLVAPTLLRSQLLASLFQSVQRAELSRREADRRLAHVRGLKVRLLGDRVLQDRAWSIAEEFGWSDTLDAEYIALTQLQADALVTLDPNTMRTVRKLVAVASYGDLLSTS